MKKKKKNDKGKEMMIMTVTTMTTTTPESNINKIKQAQKNKQESGTLLQIPAELSNIVYFVYIWPAICTVQLINTWHQAGHVDYSD